MFKIKINGLKELERKLERLPKEIQKEIEVKLREAANRIVLSAQMKCPDAKLREKITCRVLSRGEQISVEISVPKEASPYLKAALEENKDSIPKEVAEAVKKAIKNV
jgi:predicted DNA-binding antitoxin AbrB/MazE fold protein